MCAAVAVIAGGEAQFAAGLPLADTAGARRCRETLAMRAFATAPIPLQAFLLSVSLSFSEIPLARLW
eukprot:4158791-Pleurochrysis_carterae.AAC.1